MGTLLVAIGIAIVELITAAVPNFSAWSGAAVAALFLALPLLFARIRGFDGDPLGIGQAPLAPGIKLGLLAALLIAIPFAAGYDLLATQGFGQRRFAGPGLLSYGEIYQGVPPATPGHITVYEEGHGLIVANHTDAVVLVHPVAHNRRAMPLVRLRPRARAVLNARTTAAWSVRSTAGASLPVGTVVAGAAATPLAPADAGAALPLSRGPGWLLWYLLSQLLVVALPEEAFFRGWVLGRLRTALPAPARTVFGVPFGRAHVLSAVLFALVHLVVTPAPHRLLVFFPGLLFAWLAERSRAIIAPVVHHTLSNALLRVAARMYL